MARRDLKYIGIIFLLLKGPLEDDEYDALIKIRRDVPNLADWQRRFLDRLIDKYFGKKVS